MYKKMRGDEFNLISYWSFDDLPHRTPEGIAGNYAVESGLHGSIEGAFYSFDASPAQNTVLTDDRGNFSIENIYYWEEAEIDLICALMNCPAAETSAAGADCTVTILQP